MARSESDEVADNMPKPAKRLSFDEAVEIVRKTMPDETATVIGNVAYSLMQRSKIHSPTKNHKNRED
jgi:hypothetical protein